MKKFLLASSIFLACWPAAAVELRTVDKVELLLYLGLWYEIASIPAPFQSPDCVGTTATYSLNPDKSIKVWNQCWLPAENRLDRIEGRAVPVDASNTKLKVSFFGPFAGDYWVIDLAQDYSYAVVGHPSRNYLWILSRSPRMDPAQYQTLLKRIQAQEYDVSRIRRTQPLAQGM